MTDQTLQNRFGAKTAVSPAPMYTADPDQARVVLNDLRRMVQGSTTARRLIAMGDDQGVVVRFMKGRDETAYVPENKTIYVVVTPHTAANARLALLYAGALREVEQNILGFARPGTAASDDQWVTENVVKNLDIIKNICQIVREQPPGDVMANFIDSLTRLGHDKVYKALTSGASDDDLLRIYAEQEQIEIKEG
jgi:hypothetical protein